MVDDLPTLFEQVSRMSKYNECGDFIESNVGCESRAVSEDYNVSGARTPCFGTDRHGVREEASSRGTSSTEKRDELISDRQGEAFRKVCLRLPIRVFPIEDEQPREGVECPVHSFPLPSPFSR